ncbi:MAG: SprT family zinc-dependent metalloprotease [Gammaproteobacteria bacterium]|jgi:predicted metal-dependent hydrolase
MTLLRMPGDITIEVTRKDIRTLRLSVHPPDGRVRLSAPTAIAQEAIHRFVCARLGWIRKHRQQIAARQPAPGNRYRDGEFHWFEGRCYALQILERPAPARVTLGEGVLTLQVRPGSGPGRCRALLDDWYRDHLKAAVPQLIAGYEPPLGVQVRCFGIRKMKTRWGSCNPRARRIWLNLELARQPSGCLEYVVVHEMVHMLEPHHNTRFYALMDRHLPRWRECREILKRLPPRA